jgi:NAD(P)-dependent dehydrogenase (short-subunit alcohol dehydrogenase family)
LPHPTDDSGKRVTVATIETQAVRGITEEPLNGRVALVTGGTRGIGAAITRRLLGSGATVAASYAVRREDAERLRGELDGQITLHEGDVASPTECRRLVDEVIAVHGRIDILVNNAGMTAHAATPDMHDADWYRVLAVNLSGSFFTAQAALGHMVEQGAGRIINISSLLAQTGGVGQANYAAAKAGLTGLTRSLARESALALKRAGRLTPAGRNITVNVVAPGYTETERLAYRSPEERAEILRHIPLGRFGRPEEIARVVHFLALDSSAWITGQVWEVNGGMHM